MSSGHSLSGSFMEVRLYIVSTGIFKLPKLRSVGKALAVLGMKISMFKKSDTKKDTNRQIPCVEGNKSGRGREDFGHTKGQID